MSVVSPDDSTGFVQTRSSLSKQGNLPRFQEVTFSRYKSDKGNNSDKAKLQTAPSTVRSVPKSKDERKTFMRKARYDIIKFGMTGFDRQKKEEAKQALAISLGAKPRKQKPINYKELKEQIKIQKELEKEMEASESVLSRAPSTKGVGRKQSSVNRYKQKSGILDVYGKANKK